MNGTPSNERLSAWLDNELSLDERAEVEKLLADSPELREELEELQRLSGHLQRLPVEKAPAGLHQAVMRSIERETLLSGDHLSSTDSSGVARRRSMRAMTTAAGVALAVGLGLWFSSDRGSDVAIVDPVGPEIVKAHQTRRDMQANRRESKNRLSVELPTRQFEIDRSELGEADIGDIIEAVRRDGDSVSIVRLTVVDREAGLESLRVLLAHQDIPLDVANAARTGGNELSRRGLVAVFVESPSEQISQTIEQMARGLSGFDLESLSISEALPIAELDSDVRSELGLADEPRTRQSARAVSVPEGGPLSRIILEPGSFASNAGAADSSSTDGGPVRVIFVLTDAPSSQPEAEAVSNGNGAA